MIVQIRIAESADEFGPALPPGNIHVAIKRGSEALAGKSVLDTPGAWAELWTWISHVVEFERDPSNADVDARWSEYIETLRKAS